MMQTLFEVSVIERAGHTAQVEGEADKLVLAPVTVLASSVEGAVLAVGVANADKLKDANLPKLDILVRTFGSAA